MRDAVFSKLVKNRGGLTLVRKYTIQTQKHPASSYQNQSSFFASLKSLTPYFH
mgnify:FL=1